MTPPCSEDEFTCNDGTCIPKVILIFILLFQTILKLNFIFELAIDNIYFEFEMNRLKFATLNMNAEKEKMKMVALLQLILENAQEIFKNVIGPKKNQRIC